MKKFLIFICFSFMLGLFFHLKINTGNTDNSINENKAQFSEIIYIYDYSSYEKIKNSDNKQIVVLGKTGCTHCSNYMNVLRKFIKDTSTDVYYIDFKKLSKDEKSMFNNSDIVIPASCTSSGVEQKLKDGFSTPLTLIFKNRNVVDCLRGYNKYENLEKAYFDN